MSCRNTHGYNDLAGGVQTANEEKKVGRSNCDKITIEDLCCHQVQRIKMSSLSDVFLLYLVLHNRMSLQRYFRCSQAAGRRS